MEQRTKHRRRGNGGRYSPGIYDARECLLGGGSCTLSNGVASCTGTPKTACGINGGTITCNIGALNAWTKGNPTVAGIQVTVKVNSPVPANTEIKNSVVVSGVANADPNLKNNTATWPTLVTN